MWVDEGKQSSGLRVKFYLRPKQDDEATKAEGRPIFHMVEYVQIEVPADRLMQVDAPVQDKHRALYPKQYEAFKADKDQDTAGGTLLSATGLFPPERLEELAFFRIRTAEQLAAVSDANLQALGLHARQERQRARDFIESAKSNAPFLRLQAEQEELRNAVATKDAQLAALQAAVEQLQKAQRPAPKAQQQDMTAEEAAQAFQEAAPRRRGRPAKSTRTEAT